eukprot:PITA_05023
MPELTKFCSCRGVSFEINTNKNNFVSDSTNEDGNSATAAAPRPRAWYSWRRQSTLSVSKLAPVLSSRFNSERTYSRSSSHFCDIDESDEEEEDKEYGDLHDIEDPVELSRPASGLKSTSLSRSKKAAAAKPGSKESRLSVILLDQCLFTVYKRLFSLCFAVNLFGLVAAITGYFPYAEEKTALFSIWNILASVLCRSEAFLRCVFWMMVKLLRWSWVPLPVKTAATSFLQTVGGIHSGCGVSSILWLIYSLHQTLSHLRHLHHNVFENFHRFAGWAAIALLWAFVILTASYNPVDKSYDVRGSSLVKKQEFWFTLLITLAIIFPWFQGGIESGILGRISRSPLSDWHAFGIISDGKEEHMMLAGAVGDFTRRLPSPADVYVIWVAKGIEENFGEEIVRKIKSYPVEKMVIHDTAVFGRPNLSEMTVEAVRRWGGEVVIVTSNPSGSRDVVNGCKAVGIPAFGPIWDS